MVRLGLFDIKTSAQCPCGEADQTPEHYLQSAHSTSKQGSRCGSLVCPSNQALGVCRGFVPDIQVCGTHGREDLVYSTITSKAEEEGSVSCQRLCQVTAGANFSRVSSVVSKDIDHQCTSCQELNGAFFLTYWWLSPPATSPLLVPVMIPVKTVADVWVCSVLLAVMFVN